MVEGTEVRQHPKTGTDTDPAPVLPVAAAVPHDNEHGADHPAGEIPPVGDGKLSDPKAAVTALFQSSDLADRFNSELLKALKVSVAPALPDLLLVHDGQETTTTGTTQPDTHGDGAGKPPYVGTDSPNKPREAVTPGVQRDAQGRVTEVDYANGTKRQFGYDEQGNLNRVVQPDGQVYKLNGDKWERENNANAPSALPQDAKPGIAGMMAGAAVGGAAQGGGTEVYGPSGPQPGDSPFYRAPGALDFKNPKVSPDGTFTWQSLDGKAETTVTASGSTIFRKDGATVYQDDKYRVSLIHYANGEQMAFSYNADGQIDYFTRGGKVFKVRDNEIFGTDGQSTGEKFPFASPDGSFTVTDAQGNMRVTKLDGTSSTSMPDGAFIQRDAQDRITEVLSADGKTRKYGYDERGRIDSITDQDGKEYKFNATIDLMGIRMGSFQAADGTKLENPHLKPDGTFVYETKDGKIHTDFPSGRSTETTMTADDLRSTARELDAFNWVFTSNTGIKEKLDKMSTADRVALDETYKTMYGVSLTDKLKGQLWNPLKQEASQGALDDLAEAHLRTKFAQSFSGTQQLTEANQALTDFRERAKKQGLTTEQIVAAEEKAAHEMDRGDTESQKRRALDKTLTDAAPTSDSLNERYSVKYDEETKPDGTKVRHYYVDGEKGEKEKILDTTSDDPKEIERQLKEWQANKIRELEGKFNVQFSQDGQTESAAGKTVDLRAPNIAELVALEKGLQQSEPSTRTSNGRPIMVQFAMQPVTAADAWVMPRPDGQDRILFEPVERMGAWGLKRTILHEWGHNAQNLMEKSDPASLEQHYSEIGYKKVNDKWYLEGKDGNLYIQGPGRVPNGIWTRVNENGEPLKADGSLASGFDDPTAFTYTNRDMREQSRVKPMTEYFPQPNERSAEAIWHFRGDKDSRGNLYLNDVTLYNSTKVMDQKSIDADPRYGKNPDGSSKFIRMPDGSIQPNDEANRKAVSDFEAQLATQRSLLERMKFDVPGTRSDAQQDLKRALEKKAQELGAGTQANHSQENRTQSSDGVAPNKKPKKHK